MIAVLTFRRPADLAAVLPMLVEQAGRVARADLAVEVLVVDNDPDGGARDQVAALAVDRPVRYVNETVPGISAARNRALAESATADLLVFIDDDERPTADWLAQLLATHETRRPAAVVGPVVSRFAVPPSPWVAAGRFFVRRRLPTGTAVTVAATNNLLLDLAVVRHLDLRFDLDFGISGGDDTMFTRQLHARGGAMVWCDEAVVHDVVPPDRTTARWVLLRALSSGNSWSLVAVKLERGPLRRIPRRLGLSGQGLARLAGGSARALVGTLLRAPAHQARGLRSAARGAGMLGGAWGWSYLEYRRPRPAAAPADGHRPGAPAVTGRPPVGDPGAP